MAKAPMDAAVSGLRGRVDNFVYKQYEYGTVVTRRPRMDKVKWSPAQKAHRLLVSEAGQTYRTRIKTNPELLAPYIAGAKRARIPVPAFFLKRFLAENQDMKAVYTARFAKTKKRITIRSRRY